MTPTLSEIAHALRGQVAGRQVLAPGPGHSHRDRSLSVRLSEGSPDGFLVHSHAGDDWRTCRDHVASALGLSSDRRRDAAPPDPAEIERRREARRRAEERERAEAARLQARARAMWDRAGNPIGTPAESYLNLRGLDLTADLAGLVLRFHPRCPWGEGTAPAMVAAIRNVETGDITGVHRTALTPEGRKIGRKVFGTAMRGAIMLDPRETVREALTAGEGIETSLTARQLGLGPVWSLISTSNIGALPVLPGIGALTILAEIDEAPNRPSATAFDSVACRWHSAGRAVDRLWPPTGCKDLNDSVRRDIP